MVLALLGDSFSAAIGSRQGLLRCWAAAASCWDMRACKVRPRPRWWGMYPCTLLPPPGVGLDVLLNHGLLRLPSAISRWTKCRLGLSCLTNRWQSERCAMVLSIDRDPDEYHDYQIYCGCYCVCITLLEDLGLRYVLRTCSQPVIDRGSHTTSTEVSLLHEL